MAFSNLEIVANFREYLDSGGYAESTIKTYSEIVYAYILFCMDRGDYKDTCYINHFTDFRKREVSNSTLNIYVSALKMFYRSMQFNLSTTVNIDLEAIRTFAASTKIPNVSTSDVKKLMQHINLYPDSSVDKAVIHLIYATGIRPSEVIYLSKNSFSVYQGRYVVNFYEQKKSRFRSVPFFDLESIYVVQNYLSSVSNYKLPFPKLRKIQYIFAAHSALSYVAINPRLMRHSFAYRCANVYNLSISELQAVLGHTNPSMSMRYALPHDDDIKLLGVKF